MSDPKFLVAELREPPVGGWTPDELSELLDAAADLIESLQAERDTLVEVAEAATHWWERIRPLAWTEQEHITTPTVNTTSARERALAEAVAARAVLASIEGSESDE
jgi:hypothetical protein